MSERDGWVVLAEIAADEAVNQDDFDAICNAFPDLLAERDALVAELAQAKAANAAIRTAAKALLGKDGIGRTRKYTVPFAAKRFFDDLRAALSAKANT